MPKTITVFEIGDQVKQKFGAITGEVLDTRLQDGKPETLVKYVDPRTNEETERWFDADQIEEI